MNTRALPNAPAVGSFLENLDEPMLRELYEYWCSKRAGRLIPQRRDIDPAEIPKLLPHLMITEMVEGGTRYRYRLAGTAVTEAFGRELTGLYVDEVMTGAYREFLERLYRTVYLNRRCVLCESKHISSRDLALKTKRLLMPLYVCRVWQGIVTAREHQALAWVRPARLAEYPMPPADKPLVAMLRELL